MQGNLIIVSAPSGAGKTTLVNELLKLDGQVKTSVSYTSRAPREDEQNGVHYHFVSADEFRGMIDKSTGGIMELHERSSLICAPVVSTLF
jgi:guanylate kinase